MAAAFLRRLTMSCEYWARCFRENHCQHRSWKRPSSRSVSLLFLYTWLLHSTKINLSLEQDVSAMEANEPYVAAYYVGNKHGLAYISVRPIAG